MRRSVWNAHASNGGSIPLRADIKGTELPPARDVHDVSGRDRDETLKFRDKTETRRLQVSRRRNARCH